jgi:hypothetical protein
VLGGFAGIAAPSLRSDPWTNGIFSEMSLRLPRCPRCYPHTWSPHPAVFVNIAFNATSPLSLSGHLWSPWLPIGVRLFLNCSSCLPSGLNSVWLSESIGVYFLVLLCVRWVDKWICTQVKHRHFYLQIC